MSEIESTVPGVDFSVFSDCSPLMEVDGGIALSWNITMTARLISNQMG